jgi:hypothetical protein
MDSPILKLKNSKSDKFNVLISLRKKVDLAKVFIGENSFKVIHEEIFGERKFAILFRNDAKFKLYNNK